MKRLLCALLAGLSLLTLSGCRSAFEREYYYETPFSGDIGTPSDDAAEIRNYNMLKTALTNMIAGHAERGEFRFVSYNGNLSEDLAAVCFEIKSEHPLGAYAVESLSYDTSYVVSYYMANIYITYKRTAEELSSIIYTSTAEDFEENVFRALDGYQDELVIRCLAPGIDERYILRLVRRHFYDDPTILIAQPEAAVTRYPAEGGNCIYDIAFRFGLDRQRCALLSMSLAGKLTQAAGAMTEIEQPKLALEAALYLSERCANGNPEAPYADTAYGPIMQGNADSKGLALAYRALCGVLGIDCTVVEGGFGSIGTQEHFWNIIGLDGAYYHVDVSAMRDDPAGAFLLNDETLWGRCIWETSEYPACDGPLSYADVAGLPLDAEDGPADAEPQPEEETEESEGEETEGEGTQEPSDAPETPAEEDTGESGAEPEKEEKNP